MRFFAEQNYDCFDVLTFSCAEKIAKPDEKIYHLTLDKLGCESQDSIFIDDKIEYVNGAKRVGMNTILFESPEKLIKELANFKITQ